MRTKTDIAYYKYRHILVALGMLFILLTALVFFQTPLRKLLLRDNPDADILQLTNYYVTCLALSGLALLAGGLALFRTKSHDVIKQASSESHDYTSADLFLISFLILFLELSLIRWVPAYTRLLSYFTNFILLACFLGMGVGCMLSRRKTNLMDILPLSLLLLVVYTLSMYLLHMYGLAVNRI